MATLGCYECRAPLGQSAQEGEFDLRAAIEAQNKRLQKMREAQKESLKFRKIATYATVAGAIFAAVRLTDIYFAVKKRRRES